MKYCSNCGKELSEYGSLDINGVDAKLMSCDTCGQMFTSPAASQQILKTTASAAVREALQVVRNLAIDLANGRFHDTHGEEACVLIVDFINAKLKGMG